MVCQERIRHLLDYDPETGIFRWRVRTSNRVRVGAVAGSLDAQNRVVIRVDGKLYLAHRLALLFATGDIPPLVDHANGNSAHNRMSNLRPATRSENAMNSGPHRDSQTGIKGVSFDRARKKWIAQMVVSGRKVLAKRFDTKEQAAAAYQAAVRLYHREFARSA